LQFEHIGELVTGLDVAVGDIIDAREPTPYIIGVVERLKVVEVGGEGHRRGAIVVGGVEALVGEAVQFIINRGGGDNPVVGVDFVTGEAQAAGVVIDVFLPNRVGFQSAAGRGGGVVADPSLLSKNVLKKFKTQCTNSYMSEGFRF